MPDTTSFLHVLLYTYVPSAAVLTLFVTAIAYLRNPKFKVFIFSIPVPFTCAYLATRIDVNATHLLGLGLTVLYHWIVYATHVKWRWPLWASIAAAIAFYVGVAATLRRLEAWPFWTVAPVLLGVWLFAVSRVAQVSEPGHRSTAPWWLKLPAIFVIALGIYSMQGLLAGAVTTFPYAGVFTSYEMRRSLRTLAGHFTVTVSGVASMIVTLYATQHVLPGHWPLVAGFTAVFLTLALVYPLALRQPRVMAVPAGSAA